MPKTKMIVVALLCLLLLTPLALTAQAQTSAIAITNVRVFDGKKLSDLGTVVIEDGKISAKTKAETTYDGQGGTLLPGFIDAHAHFEGVDSLETTAQWGVTTMLDMGSAKPDDIAAAQALSGISDILSSFTSAAPPNTTHAKMGCVPISTPQEARAFVEQRAAEGAAFIKVIADSPGNKGVTPMNEAVLAEIAMTAHKHGLKTIAHVTLDSSVNACFRTNIDVITHLPLGTPINAELATKLSKKSMAAIPTLIMMQCFDYNMPEENRPEGVGYDNAAASLAALKKANITIMAGTDANTNVCYVQHGESLHDELQLMVEAGLTPVEALQSATTIPARYFGLKDRGAIKPGLRADLVLVDGDPTQDISATKNITAVWVNGVQAF